MGPLSRPRVHPRRLALARPSPPARATAALAVLAAALPGSGRSQGLGGADGPCDHRGGLRGP
eukprot:10081432-Alexandrium_andersonii.AAC.1